MTSGRSGTVAAGNPPSGKRARVYVADGLHAQLQLLVQSVETCMPHREWGRRLQPVVGVYYCERSDGFEREVALNCSLHRLAPA